MSSECVMIRIMIGKGCFWYLRKMLYELCKGGRKIVRDERYYEENVKMIGKICGGVMWWQKVKKMKSMDNGDVYGVA